MTHNFWIGVGVMCIIVLVMIYWQPYTARLELQCMQDSDCIPEQCCHPTSCVNLNHVPECTEFACTTVCEGPIDCGAGDCGCVNKKCEVIPRG